MLKSFSAYMVYVPVKNCANCAINYANNRICQFFDRKVHCQIQYKYSIISLVKESRRSLAFNGQAVRAS